MHLLRMSNRNETSFVGWSKAPCVGGPLKSNKTSASNKQRIDCI